MEVWDVEGRERNVQVEGLIYGQDIT